MMKFVFLLFSVTAFASGRAVEQSICAINEYCCPDAKHCLAPTGRTCKEIDTVCNVDETCCPLTKLCVKVGAPCKTPCVEADSYCCPLAKACLTPTRPGVICSVNETKGGSPCWSDEVCCPLTNLCVKAHEKCQAP